MSVLTIFLSAISVRGQPTLGDAVDAPALVWTTGVNPLFGGEWTGQTSITHDGVDAAQSGALPFDFLRESWLETSVVGPGTLNFWWKVSSERDFDWLRFHVNGVLQHQISGEVNWQSRSYSLPQGSHTLRWRYVKDFSDTAGSDRGWVDQVSFTPASGAPVIAVQPVSQTVWEGAKVKLSVVALGTPPLGHQWLFNETNLIAGATDTSLSLNGVLQTNAGGYRVVVSNSSGSVTSAVAAVIVTNRSPVTSVLLLVEGQVTSAYEEALLQLGLPYQRYAVATTFDQAVNSANRASTLAVIDATDGQHNFAGVTNFIRGGGRVLAQAFAFAAHPGLAAAFGGTVEQRFNTPIPVYDWGASPLFAGLSSPLSMEDLGLNEDGQKFHVTPATAYGVAGFVGGDTAGEAAVVVANAGRTIVNGFFLQNAVSGADAIQFARNEIQFLTSPVSGSVPLIKSQPLARTVAVGADLTLRVVAWGGQPLSYQWIKDSVAMPGATASSYVRVGPQAFDSGDYQVVVSNSFGAVTSSVAAVAVVPVGPVSRVLFYSDEPVISPYSGAVSNLSQTYNFTYESFANETAFNSAVATANPVETIVIVESALFLHSFNTLADFMGAGGRAIAQYWNLQPGSTLAAAFDATVAGAYNSPPPVHDWGVIPLFAGLSSPLSLADWYYLDGQRLGPMAGGQAVAGYVSSPSLGEAALILGNGGRTLLSGFLPQEITPTSSGLRLAQNEIEYLLSVRAAQLSSPAWAAGQFQVMLSGTTGQTYSLRASTNSVHWTTVTNVTLSASPMLISVPAPADWSFYRAVTPPVP